MALIDKLTKITGIEERESNLRLIDGTPTGKVHFLNSGVNINQLDSLNRDRTVFIDFGKGYSEFAKTGERISPTLLLMPRNALTLPPHCHPGGEVAFVAEGEYFDADMNGNVLQRYTKGSLVAYGPFSTHRPLSQDGAVLFYVPYDGIVFPSNPQEITDRDPEVLVAKMEKCGAPPESVIYARKWMFKDRGQGELFNK